MFAKTGGIWFKSKVLLRLKSSIYVTAAVANDDDDDGVQEGVADSQLTFPKFKVR